LLPVPTNGPEASEVVSGPFIKLLTADVVQWPECLLVQKSAFPKFYGHFVLKDQPRLDSIVIYKQGKKMASMTLANTSRELKSILVFPTSFAKAYMNIKEGNSYKFVFGKTKDGTVTLDDVLI
jgi:hypothetical protein